jgi:hypothetical protein
MTPYHKIQTVFKRNMDDKGKSLIMDSYSMPEFEFLKDNQWVWTEKIHGACIRVIIKDGRVSFNGKTDSSQIPSTLVEQLRRKFDPQAEKLNEKFPEGACLYGEGCGPNIQKGGEGYGPVPQFVLFDCRVGPWWLSREAVNDVADVCDVSYAPIVAEGTLGDLVSVISAGGFKSHWGDFAAEGVVARPKVELFARSGERIITKLKIRDFQK